MHQRVLGINRPESCHGMIGDNGRLPAHPSKASDRRLKAEISPPAGRYRKRAIGMIPFSTILARILRKKPRKIQLNGLLMNCLLV
ncbi:MAG: hypothetical protein R3F54_09735 [Alphaproteobacteria bacterium]